MKKLLIIFISLFFLTGCYNYHELETLGITSSILFDFKDNKYDLTIETIENNKPIIVKGSGKSISLALEEALLSSGKTLSYYHLNTVILTKNVNAKEVLLYLLRNPQVNNTFYIVLTENTDIYNEEEDIGKKISEILKRNQGYTFFEISKTLYDDKIDMLLPIINEKISVLSMMPYSKFKITKEMDLDHIDIYKMLANINGAYISAKCPKEAKDFEVNINEVKSKFKVEDEIKVEVELETSLSEFNCSLNTDSIKNITAIEKAVNEKLDSDIEKMIKELQDLNADILGINRYIYEKNHNLKKTWLDYEYKVEVKTHINKKGLILK